MRHLLVFVVNACDASKGRSDIDFARIVMRHRSFGCVVFRGPQEDRAGSETPRRAQTRGACRLCSTTLGAVEPRQWQGRLTALTSTLSAAEAGHLLGVHRATVYRWLDGFMSVPIVVELLLPLVVRRGIGAAEVTASRHGQTSAKPRSGRSQGKSAKPFDHNTGAKSKQPAVRRSLERALRGLAQRST
jgi:hypothetical protein